MSSQASASNAAPQGDMQDDGGAGPLLVTKLEVRIGDSERSVLDKY